MIEFVDDNGLTDKDLFDFMNFGSTTESEYNKQPEDERQFWLCDKILGYHESMENFKKSRRFENYIFFSFSSISKMHGHHCLHACA